MKANIINRHLVIKNRSFERDDIVEIFYGTPERRKIVIGRIMGFTEIDDNDILIKLDTSSLYNSHIDIIVVSDITQIRHIYKEV